MALVPLASAHILLEDTAAAVFYFRRYGSCNMSMQGVAGFDSHLEASDEGPIVSVGR